MSWLWKKRPARGGVSGGLKNDHSTMYTITAYLLQAQSSADFYRHLGCGYSQVGPGPLPFAFMDGRLLLHLEGHQKLWKGDSSCRAERHTRAKKPLSPPTQLPTPFCMTVLTPCFFH